MYSQRCYGALQESQWSADEYYPRGRKGTQPPSQHHDRNQQRNWNGHVKIRKNKIIKLHQKYFFNVYYVTLTLSGLDIVYAVGVRYCLRCRYGHCAAILIFLTIHNVID